jgi:hypothetical protein
MVKFFLTLFMCMSFAVSASNHEPCFPKNDIRIPVSHSKSINSMDEAAFNKAIDDIENLYKPIVKESFKANLTVDRKWSDETVNAYAQQSGKEWNVAMFGGLARHPAITQDGFRAVVCHEVGHHIGGAVRKGASWASNEGQADFWATSHCLKKYFEVDHEKTIEIYRAPKGDANSKYAKRLCDETHSSLLEAATCFRGAMAGQSLAELFRALRSSTQDLRFDTPDKKEVTKTNHAHPDSQCRMDTYFAGSLCDKDFDILTDAKDVAVGYCTEKEKYKLGVRPHCWYVPAEYEK